MPDKKIRVLFISSWFPSRVKPTASKFVLRHAEAISLYTDITILHVCFDKNKSGNKFDVVEETKGNINIINIYIDKPILIFNKLFLYLRAYKKGYELISNKYGTPDIIHANVIFPVGLVFLFLKSFKMTPFVFTEHWTGYLPENPLRISFLKKYFIKKIISQSSFILPVSSNLMRAMLDMRLKGNYRMIPNVVDTNLFSERTKEISSKNILHISSLQDKHKNVSGILRVIKQLSMQRNDFSLHFISNGNQKPFIEMAEKLSVLNKNVFFHAGKKTEEIAEIMHNSELLILFSNYENLPCVVIEALSCGLPMIATDVGDISKYISKEFGIVIKPNDDEGLYNAINFMIDNLEKYNSTLMHEFAVKKFSYQVVGKQFYDVYSKILNKTKPCVE